MKYVFGPVPSRRLGSSLGIDPIPFKTCNWNCVYCQLGRSVPLVNQRREYFPAPAIVAEVQRALTLDRREEIDWVTFIGSGEPTLHSRLGWMIRQVKSTTTIPLAVVTNGSLLCLPHVREELAVADAVLPSLDAGTPSLYRKVNRPHPDCRFERLVEGLIDFRGCYQGKLWVEVMLVKDLNDSEKALEDIAAVLSRVRPDEVHLSSPHRAPAERWVEAPDDERLARAAAVIGRAARVVSAASGAVDLSGFDTVVEAVNSIISRHPMEEAELIRTLRRWSDGEVTGTLAELAATGRARVVHRHNKRFWTSARARYQQHPTGHSA